VQPTRHEEAVAKTLPVPRLANAVSRTTFRVALLNAFHGVYAALLTPRSGDGELNIASYQRQVAELNRFGLTGYAINGATGEFTISTDADLELLTQTTRENAPAAQVLCGIGASDLATTIRRGRIAASGGATAVLLPMPSFFPYRQDDLVAYVSAVALSLEVPILLYNLPQFTSGLEVDTVLSLFSRHSNIVGIKDSSGSLDIVRAITAADLPHARIIGNDSALAEALAGDLCDAVISGVACTLPELMTGLYATAGKGEDFGQRGAQLSEFIEHLGPMPTPWGLKVTSALRQFTEASYPFPLSAEREVESASLSAWFRAWLPSALG
jgi:4-hydroxy-tetrahydrodipicolinate synthase